METKNQYVIYPHPENEENQANLTPQDKLVYLAIRRYMNKDTMEAFPSYERLKADIKAVPRTIKKCVDNLVREGYLETEKRGRSIVYKFNKLLIILINKTIKTPLKIKNITTAQHITKGLQYALAI